MARFYIIMLVSVVSFNIASAQNSPRETVRKERKLTQYLELKQAALDSVFVFQTKKIITPFVPSNWSGGYLNIKANTVRIQELDWVNDLGEKIRLNQTATIQDYKVVENHSAKSFRVTFSSMVNGTLYNFIISHTLDIGSELEIGKGHETMKYSGKIKR